MQKLGFLLLLCLFLPAVPAAAAIFGRVQGIVHDPQHRPVAGAVVTLTPAGSAVPLTGRSGDDGAFSFPSVALGDYSLSVAAPGFRTVTQPLTLASDTTQVLHFELALATVRETARVTAERQAADIDSATPTVLVSRDEIDRTPGADRTDAMTMITDYVPGAYMTHDMLHMRGGHQVSWLIDGVEIPNTNIASNLAAQIDPKDIDYLEVQRGSYTADIGDRTYGVFNVVPRTGFDRDRQAELVLSAGSFLSTDDQLSLGDHTEKLGWYASLNANRSDYGLAPPVARVLHDAANGYGAFLSVIDNLTPKDQLRFVGQFRQDFFEIPYDPDPNDFENQQFDSSGLRDVQHETDAVAAFSYIRTFSPTTVLELSPFYHLNRADYSSNPNDTPTATTSDRSSNYGGAQASLTTEIGTATLGRATLSAGLYSFGQHDAYLYGAVFNDGSGTPSFQIPDSASGGVVEEYLSADYKPRPWLTVITGVRATQFRSAFAENEIDPRFGLAVRVPRLGWVFRGFYGHFYQPPPLLTAAGPVVQYAEAQNTSFAPLHGERDEEHQFGVEIPYRGWLLDADTFKTRVNNFLDHSNIGDSSIYYPVTVDGALVRAWELTLRSPRLWRYGQAHLAYSNQIAEQRGAITGGLICYPVSSPECDVAPGYTPVDHDQRNTLNVGFSASLPARITGSANVYYGSGFTNGDPDPTTPYPGNYLPAHSQLDLSVGKSFGESTTASVTATNVTNHRVLLDNSLTFGGFHYNDPRQIYGELRYRFKF